MGIFDKSNYIVNTGIIEQVPDWWHKKHWKDYTLIDHADKHVLYIYTVW